MPRTYELSEVLTAAISAARSSMHVCLPAVVESFDEDTQTISATPVVLNPITDPDTGDQDTEQFPTIPNVPVMYPRGGGFACSFPLAKGDHVVLIFSELSTAQWRESGDVSEPLDTRRQSMSYPFAFPGAFPDAAALADRTTYAGKMVLGKDGDPTGSIRVASGSIEVGGTSPLVTAAAVQAAINAMMTLIGTQVSLITAVTPGAGPGGTISAGAPTVTPATVTKGQ